MTATHTARRVAALLLAIAPVLAPRPAAAQAAPAATEASAPRAAHADDAMFMRMMIPHHAQALEMSALARTRTTRHGLRMLAERIEVAQRDEIAWMQRWLREHGEAQPVISASIPLTAAAIAAAAAAGVAASAATTPSAAPADPSCPPEHAAMGHCTPRPPATATAPVDHAAMGHGSMDHALMAGMLTPAQMADLAASTGDAFDRRFLVYMTGHHEGALTMVRDLFAAPGAAQTPFVYRFATDIDADQRSDIRRMAALLATLPPDPTFRPGTPVGPAPAPPPAPAPHHR